MEDGVKKARSFRYEDYNNRRVFLRSYPLHWGDEDEITEGRETGKVVEERSEMKPIKKAFLAVSQWGEGKIFVLRRFKDKVAVYVVACIPIRFKATTALIAA